MIRWIFFVLIVANCFPALFAGNNATLPISVAPAVEAESFPASGKKLQLLSEVGTESQQDKRVSVESKSLPERRELACFVVGPLASMAITNGLVERMVGEGFAVKSMWRDVESGADFWVYLSPQPSSRATARLLQELKASNIDSFIVADGDLEGSIAISVYNDEQAASERQSQLEDLGYDANIHKMQRWVREYWLLSDTVPAGDAWTNIVSAFENGDLPQKMSRRSCKTVASVMRFQ